MDCDAPLTQVADTQDTRYDIAAHVVKDQHLPDGLPGIGEYGRVGGGQAGDVCIVGVRVLSRRVEIEDALDGG